LWGWRYSFLVLAVSLFLSFLLLGTLRAETRLRLVRPRPRLIFDVLRQRVYLRIYLVVFCLFLVFAAVMNFLPFRLTELSAQANELRIGLMYSGYTMGIVTSLNAVRIGRWLGGPCRAILAGLALYLVALAGLDAGRPEVLFAVIFLFCAAMFFVHATASGFVNALAGPNKGMVNGLYVAFYYAGGTIGSFLPGIAYRQWGWGIFLVVLAAVAATGLALAAGCRRPEAVAPKSG
ncbi:MAG TPA: hypothetical protein VJ955_08855, partial [Desulfuromonadales bacterium]|nr:hypothetical protein [Desulfuromonadales bacterium]